jgi:CheY-like chemotaxis protein
MADVPCILIVDDNEDNRYTLQLLLESDGHERVASASSGNEAIALLEKQKFSLVLLDLMMPDLNGDEVLKLIKSDPDKRDIPVIMISADTDAEKVSQCIELGADDYLSKPFNPTIVGFGKITARMKAFEIVACLNQLFSEFDKLGEDAGTEKIKTIGDNYMAVCGVPTPRPNHARFAVKFALDMVAATARLRSRLPVPFTIRVGLHSGPVMAGVIGTRKFAYDVWGDTVNIAARMEAASQPNHVLASAATVKALGSEYAFDGPQKIETKEGRVLEAFFVNRPLDDVSHLQATKTNQPREEAIK